MWKLKDKCFSFKCLPAMVAIQKNINRSYFWNFIRLNFRFSCFPDRV